MKVQNTILTICFLFVMFGYGQIKLTGKVVNFKNKPVENAKIFLDSIYSKVVTNKNGDFEILIPERVNTINIYSDKYGLLSSKFNNEDKMSFVFLEANNSKTIKKGSNVSIAYSESNQKYEVINSKSINAANDINKGIYNTIYDMIRGRLAGVSVSRDNKITIQGVSSINFISEPLFVIDGVIVTSIDYVSPNNVKLIKVLKGAEASVYGSQGSSGVIEITTK